jgi:hypothetical protein
MDQDDFILAAFLVVCIQVQSSRNNIGYSQAVLRCLDG